MCTARRRNVLRPRRWHGGPTETEVLIGVEPHKESVALAAVDEATSELVELAIFPQSRVGLRSLERWARRFPERHWAVENAGGLGRHLAVRLASRWWTCRRSFRAGESAL
jgi:hypothetical protein